MAKEKKIETDQAVQKNDWRKWLNYEWITRNIPFFLFLSALAVLYIYNGHYADKMSRKIGTVEKHIKELEYEYKTIQADVIFRSKASELAKAVEPLGLKELKIPAVVLSDTMK
ncbi:MAG: FtsL-like putative cell division protein [Ferruginibacter sp.]